MYWLWFAGWAVNVLKNLVYETFVSFVLLIGSLNVGSSLARHAFNVQDEPLLRHLRDDNLRIEPEWYIPVIPMVLVNGAEGIGTGWSTKIHNYNVREIVSNLRRMLDGQQPTPMVQCLSCYHR